VDTGTIGVIHPGEMGAGIAGELVRSGLRVGYAGQGRSAATKARAESKGIVDLGSLETLCAESAIIFSICPPDAALEVAESVRGFPGTYVDANAVAPRTARAVAEIVEAGGAHYVDGGIIGTPPDETTTPRLYLSGDGADAIAALFAGSRVDASVVSKDPTAASAVKVGYSAWSKGSSALLLAVLAFARGAGVEETIVAEWAVSQKGTLERAQRSAASIGAKAWRWAGEMEEIAAALAEEDLPNGFHESAAEVYRRASPAGSASDLRTLDELLAGILDPQSSARHRRALGGEQA
jgi:3-hydroxyisobutyrate dehydrogenase-like beta-hydroxyacid dehydrogenase